MEAEFVQLCKISQQQFNALYLKSMDDIEYRPSIEGKRQFYIHRLLEENGYKPSLSGLCLRNLDFRYADLSGIDFGRADLSGTNFLYANCADAAFSEVTLDANTCFLHAKMGPIQFSALQRAAKACRLSPVRRTESVEFDPVFLKAQKEFQREMALPSLPGIKVEMFS